MAVTQNPDGSCRIKANEELRHNETRGHSKIYTITKIKMASSCNENGENKNHQTTVAAY
jgi:hypothetical protein